MSVRWFFFWPLWPSSHHFFLKQSECLGGTSGSLHFLSPNPCQLCLLLMLSTVCASSFLQKCFPSCSRATFGPLADDFQSVITMPLHSWVMGGSHPPSHLDFVRLPVAHHIGETEGEASKPHPQGLSTRPFPLAQVTVPMSCVGTCPKGTQLMTFLTRENHSNLSVG